MVTIEQSMAKNIEAFVIQSKTTDLSYKPYINYYKGLNVKTSFGQGSPARISWISMRGEGQQTSNGIYVSVLYFKPNNVLVIAYGISEENKPKINWDIPFGTSTIKEYFKVQSLGKPDRYKDSFIYKIYDDSNLDYEQIVDDTNNLISKYKEVLMKNNLPVDATFVAPDPRGNGQKQEYYDEEYIKIAPDKPQRKTTNKSWIVPGNNDIFRCIDFFENYSEIDWCQNRYKYQVGDIVYIYHSDKTKKILHKVVVTRTDIPKKEMIDDSEFFVGGAESKGEPYVRFKLIKTLDIDDDRLAYNKLKENGLKSKLQGPFTINNKNLLSYIEDVFNTPKPMTKEGVKQIQFDINKAKQFVNDTKLIYDDVFFKRYVYSLLTKPFVILSGLAGSGKTQLALAFAKAMVEDEKKQMCVVSVGADWTNREPLLGYPNALKDEEYVHPESGVLDFLIECNKEENKDKPFFLILDEMNLSYVERYFADFLSAMESHQEISLWDADVDNDDIVPSTIGLPKNLFIVGTINVDETTYMFSPKVLDRANVIEFQVSADDMIKFLSEAPSVDVETIKGKCANMAADFVRIVSEKVDASTEANGILGNFFKVLKVANAEFGYRTASEIGRFLSLSKDDLSIDVATDSAIVQKLLPKLHGSRKKMVDVLKALFDICKKDGADTSLEKIEELDSSLFKYPISADKIVRMYKGAINNGYTSFAEA